MKNRWWWAPVLAVVAGGPAGAADGAPAPRKKLIELGWDIPGTRFLRVHHRQMEKEGLFDGVIFRVEAEAGGGRRT